MKKAKVGGAVNTSITSKKVGEGVTSAAMKKYGRGIAKVKNQKGG